MSSVAAFSGVIAIKSPADEAGRNPFGPVQGGKTGGETPKGNVAPKGAAKPKGVYCVLTGDLFQIAHPAKSANALNRSLQCQI